MSFITYIIRSIDKSIFVYPHASSVRSREYIFCERGARKVWSVVLNGNYSNYHSIVTRIKRGPVDDFILRGQIEHV
jgi:hypothetical protein